MLHILLGRARTGKSARVLEEICALGDSSQQILLVPEHASHVAEVDVCRACGATASRHAEVLTFKLLASRVLTLTGGAAGGGRSTTAESSCCSSVCWCRLRRACASIAAPHSARRFWKVCSRSSKNCRPMPSRRRCWRKRPRPITGESGERLRDVALLYGAYLAKLHEGGRDARDRLEKLEENLRPPATPTIRTFFSTAFPTSRAASRNILRILLKRAKSVTVTLLGDGSDSELFAEGLRVREQLYALARDAGVPCTEEVLRGGAPARCARSCGEAFLRRQCPLGRANGAAAAV